jgi:hypothetical protein
VITAEAGRIETGAIKMTTTNLMEMTKTDLVKLIAATEGVIYSKTQLKKLTRDELVQVATHGAPSAPAEGQREFTLTPADVEPPTVVVKTATGMGKSRKWGLDQYLQRHQRQAYNEKTIRKIVDAVVASELQAEALQAFGIVVDSVEVTA